MRKDAGLSKAGNMSRDERARKKKKKRQRQGVLHNIKARALKKMGFSPSGATGGGEDDAKGAAQGEDRPRRRKPRSKGGPKSAESKDAKPRDQPKKRTTKPKLLYKKTRKGQPVMKHKIEDILSRIT